MKKILVALMTLTVAFAANAQIASDNAGNYSGGWTNGSNGGTGFGAWTLSSGAGTGAAGHFIGDPSTTPGIGGMGTQAFGLYANPAASGAFANADRTLSTALAVGQTFSFVWGINWDSGAGGNKGFNLYSGGVGGTELLNVNNASSDVITLNGNNVGFGFGTSAMTWSFTLTDATTLSVLANDRDGAGSYSTNLTVAGGVDSFRFYASSMQAGDQAQPYFNDFQVVPEPSTIGLAIAGLAGLAIARRRKQ